MESSHNAAPWCEEIVRISEMLGHPIKAKPVKAKRDKGRVYKHVEPGHLTQRELGRWPHEVPGITPATILKLLK